MYQVWMMYGWYINSLAIKNNCVLNLNLGSVHLSILLSTRIPSWCDKSSQTDLIDSCFYKGVFHIKMSNNFSISTFVWLFWTLIDVGRGSRSRCPPHCIIIIRIDPQAYTGTPTIYTVYGKTTRIHQRPSHGAVGLGRWNYPISRQA